MENKKMDLADNKILILYILKKIDSTVSYKELLELVISISDINYFDFKETLESLINDKYILRDGEGDNSNISITNNGLDALDLTINMLPRNIKIRC